MIFEDCINEVLARHEFDHDIRPIGEPVRRDDGLTVVFLETPEEQGDVFGLLCREEDVILTTHLTSEQVQTVGNESYDLGRQKVFDFFTRTCAKNLDKFVIKLEDLY